MSIEPDTQDCTWVLRRPCPDCGFDAPDADAVRPEALPDPLRKNTRRWFSVLDGPDAAVRRYHLHDVEHHLWDVGA